MDFSIWIGDYGVSDFNNNLFYITMDKTEKIKEEVLNRELRKNVEQKTMLEYELALQKQLEPNEESVKVPARMSEDGRTPLSYKTIKRSDYIILLEGKIEDVDLRIKTIESL